MSCPSCRLTFYATAGWVYVQHCPSCGTSAGEARRLVSQALPIRRDVDAFGQREPASGAGEQQT